MGITAFDIKLLEKYIDKYKPQTVIELGSQNLYLTATDNPPFASEWYNEKGLYYKCIDLGGDNNSIQKDLAFPISVGRQYDLVTDFGTSEHCVQMEGYEPLTYNNGVTSIYPKGGVEIDEGYYNCWLNKHNLCKVGGLIISENPMTSMWQGHGYSYLGKDFYTELAKISGYELLESGLEGATGNWETGVNVYGVIRKMNNSFLHFEEFKTLPIYKQ